jgi:hypothetical protein
MTHTLELETFHPFTHTIHPYSCDWGSESKFNRRTDATQLITEEPLNQIASKLKQVLKSEQQVIAILIDHHQIVENLNQAYLKEITNRPQLRITKQGNPDAKGRE